jgi:hypothetical protein
VVDFKKRLADLEWRRSLPKFWADDFDIDLLKVFPHIRDIIGPTIDVPIWTIGHESYGRLNCPTAWTTDKGLSCVMRLAKPNLPREKNGWVNINGCVAQEAEIEGTWLEWLRDEWVHGQSWTLLLRGLTFSCVDYNRCFYPIMAHKRGWEGYENVDHAYRMARLWLSKANRRFARAVEEFRLGR